jgi:hypothetical protein
MSEQATNCLAMIHRIVVVGSTVNRSAFDVVSRNVIVSLCLTHANKKAKTHTHSLCWRRTATSAANAIPMIIMMIHDP